MNGTRTVTVNALPAVPINPSANKHCGPGAVTFSATTVTAGSTIDWYTAGSSGSTVSRGYGVATYSPSITQSATYHAQARGTTGNCLSAARIPVPATVNAYAGIGEAPSHLRLRSQFMR